MHLIYQHFGTSNNSSAKTCSFDKRKDHSPREIFIQIEREPTKCIHKSFHLSLSHTQQRRPVAEHTMDSRTQGHGRRRRRISLSLEQASISSLNTKQQNQHIITNY